ncbi:MAG TPA: hypothetical protein VN677_14240 [Gemmatimonadaceae bacterium]|nr:hypothetical protein [Gemmatimonadaceae bacterium]
MQQIPLPLADRELRAALAGGLSGSPQPTPRAAQLAEYLARVFGPSTTGIVHYGSHVQRSDARPESAHDYFVIVERYADAYKSLAATISPSYRAATAAFLNRILPPNVISITLHNESPPLEAKCAIYSLSDFLRACSARAKDHFALGRLFQHVQLIWTKDAVHQSRLTDALQRSRALTWSWGRPYLPSRFDVESYCRVLLATSYAAEIRPEGLERVDDLVTAQREILVPMYSALLAHFTSERIVATDGKVYMDLHPPGAVTRARTALYFRRSKIRATLRWLKYMALYDNWQEYILRKIARRSGISVELTARERRWPLIFLWPKALRYLRARPQRRI